MATSSLPQAYLQQAVCSSQQCVEVKEKQFNLGDLATNCMSLSGSSVLVAILSLLQVQNAEKGGAAGVIVAGKQPSPF